MTRDFAKRIREQALHIVYQSGASHIGSCLSCADILAVLYADVLNIRPDDPEWLERDRFILSKGHAAAILYATLAERGFFPKEMLSTYLQNKSLLCGHITKTLPGIELSTGALGHGLPVGCGMALAALHDGRKSRVIVLLSDGEIDEGSNWEAFLFAPHHKLGNLTAIIDYNKLQSFGRTDDVLSLEPLADKLRAFRWDVTELDGHDHEAIKKALRRRSTDVPHCIVAHTIKGMGVSYMQNSLEWHYKTPNCEQLKLALQEIEDSK